MRKLNYVLIVLVLLFYACAKKIDGTSDESMQASVKEIKASLNEEKRKEFEEALGLITFYGLDFSEIMKEGGVEKTSKDIKKRLDGMGADEVIKRGREIKAEIERKKKEQAKQEINELYQQKKTSEEHRNRLKQFEVKRSRFYKRKKGSYYVTEEPIIELTVMNGTNHPVSRAYFEGTLASPGRSVPWVQQEFNYEISGGLEPGEEVTWYLAPNMFSDWGKVDAPKDAVLTVEVLRLDDAKGDQLYSVDVFDDGDQERLKELLSSYPEFKVN